MNKELKYFGPGVSTGPVADVAAAIVAVAAINGHEPDDAEIAELLTEQGSEVNELLIADVRSAIANETSK